VLIIGERINGMFRAVGKAVADRDKEVIQQLARDQVAGGANYLDVNVGPASAEPLEAMVWLVETIQEATDKPLAIDSPKVEVLEAGLKACRNGAMINSTDARPAKLEPLMALAKQHECPIIGLTMDDRGIPGDANGRAEMAMQICAAALDAGVPTDRLYLDPLILPINCAQEGATQVLEAIRQCKLLCDPPPKTVLGLSNVSQGSKYRELINRTYLVMALTAGLDAAIVDALDTELVHAMITAEMLLSKNIYCDDYIKAYLSM
jgi:5-methyltetrahydrofolate corrinoid/iron sulfur protein methyltransferase